MHIFLLLLFQAFDSLLRKLHKYVPFGASVADLYAGAGVIGLSLAATKKCRQEWNVPNPSDFSLILAFNETKLLF